LFCEFALPERLPVFGPFVRDKTNDNQGDNRDTGENAKPNG